MSKSVLHGMIDEMISDLNRMKNEEMTDEDASFIIPDLEKAATIIEDEVRFF